MSTTTPPAAASTTTYLISLRAVLVIAAVAFGAGAAAGAYALHEIGQKPRSRKRVSFEEPEIVDGVEGELKPGAERKPLPRGGGARVLRLFDGVDSVGLEVKGTLHCASVGGRGIERRPFERLHERLAAGVGWASVDPSWTRRVTYRMREQDARLSYEAEGDTSCRRHVVHDLAAVTSGDLTAVIRRSSRPQVVPPPKDSRYKDVRVDMTRRFHKRSSAVPGFAWCFELTVRWHGVCVRDLDSAPPRYLASVVMQREWLESAPAPVVLTTEVRMWLAQNILLKLRDAVVQSGEGDLTQCAARLHWSAAGDVTPAPPDDAVEDAVELASESDCEMALQQSDEPDAAVCGEQDE
ncbi:hypothetical protein JKP88DRAFT_273077 [Tribonema minus]|uniref:Uncharacterized protein n=1 Tax=Tribonema minus TaxID=303371 RepID=A0A836CER8_9STRA|nr:hypothetical protein JKP88DRAFT_273077 [Tribonema minus]